MLYPSYNLKYIYIYIFILSIESIQHVQSEVLIECPAHKDFAIT